jgi:hypothetical protein
MIDHAADVVNWLHGLQPGAERGGSLPVAVIACLDYAADVVNRLHGLQPGAQ